MTTPADPLKNLEVLVCPVCKGRLECAAEKIECPSCQLAFPIVDGIPVLIRARASKL